MANKDKPDADSPAQQAAAAAIAEQRLEGREPSPLGADLLRQVSAGELSSEQMRQRLRERYTGER